MGLAKLRDLRVPAPHVAHAILGGDHAGQTGDLQLRLQVVGGLRGIRILEQDRLEAGFLVDGAVALLRRALLEAEPQPAVVRIDERTRRAGFLGALGLQRGHLGALAGDAGDDRNAAVDGLDVGADERDLFVRSEEGAFTGMPQNDQALDPVHGGQPARHVGVGGVIDIARFREGCDGSGAQSAEIHDRHCVLPFRADDGNVPFPAPQHSHLRNGNDCGNVPELWIDHPRSQQQRRDGWAERA